MRATHALLIGFAAMLATNDAQSRDVRTTAALGDSIEVADGVMVQPHAVIEDSRCPAEVRCISAGRVVLAADVLSDGKATPVRLVLASRQAVPGGSLTLNAVRPVRHLDAPPAPQDYRFTFDFAASS